MWEDPIVADVLAIREKLAAKFDFDVKAIFADLRQRQGSLGGKVIPQKKRGATTNESRLRVPSASSESTSSNTASASELNR